MTRFFSMWKRNLLLSFESQKDINPVLKNMSYYIPAIVTHTLLVLKMLVLQGILQSLPLCLMSDFSMVLTQEAQVIPVTAITHLPTSTFPSSFTIATVVLGFISSTTSPFWIPFSLEVQGGVSPSDTIRACISALSTEVGFSLGWAGLVEGWSSLPPPLGLW